MARALDRRRFLASSAAAIAAPVMIPSSVFGQGRPAPSERINLAVIGLGGNGSGKSSLLYAFLDEMKMTRGSQTTLTLQG